MDNDIEARRVNQQALLLIGGLAAGVALAVGWKFTNESFTFDDGADAREHRVDMMSEQSFPASDPPAH